MKITNLLILLVPFCSSLAATNADYPYKKLLAEGMELESYYVKADQSSEIAQTRYHRGLFIMSELSALRAKSQFEKADENIDFYISKVAGSNLKGVMPWNRNKYKKELTDKALELRLLLATQEEDLKALIQEIENQLAKMNAVSASETLDRLEKLIQVMEANLLNASPEERPAIIEAISLLKDTKDKIIKGIENEEDVSGLVNSAAKMVDRLIDSGRGTRTPNGLEKNDALPANDSQLKTSNHNNAVFSSGNDSPSHAYRGSDLDVNFRKLNQENDLIDQNKGNQHSDLKNRNPSSKTNEAGIRFIGQNNGGSSFVQLPDGRKIRVSRPPQDWPNGKATGYESIYDDRSGGNLIKEEQTVFERFVSDNGYEIKEIENSKSARKWNFRIKESGGFDDRYSLTNLGNEVDFEVTSWILRDNSRNVIERLDGNNLHFDPIELSEGDYSIEVAGTTGWNSPFTVVASVLR